MGKRKLGLSVLEKRIGLFIHNYGVDEFITYLEDYDKDYKAEDYRIFQELKQITCVVFDIPQAELKRAYIKPVNADARRCITYCAYTNTRLTHDGIGRLLNVSRRSVEEYLETADYRLKNPDAFKDFVTQYNEIYSQFIKIKSIFDGKANADSGSSDASREITGEHGAPSVHEPIVN